MLSLISEIVDYLLAQTQVGGEQAPVRSERQDGEGRGRHSPRQVKDTGRPASSFGPTPESAVSLVSQDMLTETEKDWYFPMPPVEMADIVCHRLMILPESGLQPLVLMVYYNPQCILKIDQPRYVLDNDVWEESSGRFWSFISIVTGSLDEAARFIEAFISRLGLASCFKVSTNGGRLSALRARCH